MILKFPQKILLITLVKQVLQNSDMNVPSDIVEAFVKTNKN